MTDQLLAEIWAWIKGAALCYGAFAAVIILLALYFIFRVWKKLMKGF